MPPKMKPELVLVDRPDEDAWYIFDGFRRNATWDVREERKVYRVESKYIDNMSTPVLVVMPPRSRSFVLLNAFVGYWWKIIFCEPKTRDESKDE